MSNKPGTTPEVDFKNDAFWGKGGRYVINAAGERVPAPPAEEVPAVAGESIPAQAGTRVDNAAPGVWIDAQGLAPLAGGAKPAAESSPKKTLKEKNRA